MSIKPIQCHVAGRGEKVFAIALFALTLAVFWPAQGFEFVNLDDFPFVAANPMVSGGLRWAAVEQAFTTVHEQWWLPLLWISYMADVSLFGPGPYGHHLVNILLHAANAGLLFWVLFRLTGSRWRSAFVAALFAWHPTRVEAVAWITARKDVLSGLFFMLALLAYVRHAERPSAKKMGLVFLLMLAGLASKAILIVLPPILLLLDYWPLRRARALWGREAWKEWRPLLGEKAALIALAAAFTGVNLWTHASGRGTGSHVPLVSRLGLIAPNYLDYLGKIAAPIRLNVVYPENDRVFWPLAFVAVAALGAATWAAIRQREKRPYWATGWLWFVAALFPVIRGVRLGLAQYADRWSYLPLIGIGIAVAWTAGESDSVLRRRWLRVAGAVVLLACLAQTSRQLRWWRDSLTLFSRAAALAPESPVARNCIGQALYAAGRHAEGAAHMQAAIQLDPANAEYVSNLGVGLLRLGRAREALALHDEAIRREPDRSIFHVNRGNALAELGRPGEAEEAFRRALALQPDNAEAHFNLGGILFRAGKAQEALPHYEAAVRGMPGGAMNWFNLGMAYAQLGRYAEARPCVERALRIDPELPVARSALMRLQSMGY